MRILPRPLLVEIALEHDQLIDEVITLLCLHKHGCRVAGMFRVHFLLKPILILNKVSGAQIINYNSFTV